MMTEKTIEELKIELLELQNENARLKIRSAAEIRDDLHQHNLEAWHQNLMINREHIFKTRESAADIRALQREVLDAELEAAALKRAYYEAKIVGLNAS